MFKKGQPVYLKNDEAQKRRVITGILPLNDRVLYQVTYGSEQSFHHEKEISKKKNGKG